MLHDNVEDSSAFERKKKKKTFNLKFLTGSKWFPIEGGRYNDATILSPQHLEDGNRSSMQICNASLGCIVRLLQSTDARKKVH